MRIRLFTFLFVVTLTFGLAVSAQAFQNEPPGFRDIQWGTDIAAFKEEMKLVKDNGDFKDYQRKDDKMELGDAQVDSIVYSFYKDRFFRVMVKYSYEWNYKRLRERMFMVYGPGSERKDDFRTWWWFGDNVSLGLWYGVVTNEGTVSFIYKPIQKEREADQMEAAKKGSLDF
jgi:hypothetical protein